MEETTLAADTTAAPKRGWLSRAWNWIKGKARSLVSRLRSVRDWVLNGAASRLRSVARWGLKVAALFVPSFVTKFVTEKGIPMLARGYYALRNAMVGLASKIGLGGIAAAGWSLTDRLVNWLTGNAYSWKAAPLVAAPGAAAGSFLLWLSGMAWRAAGIIGLGTIAAETAWRWFKSTKVEEAEAAPSEDEKVVDLQVAAAKKKAAAPKAEAPAKAPKARKPRKPRAAKPKTVVVEEEAPAATPEAPEAPVAEEAAPVVEAPVAETVEEAADEAVPNPADHFSPQGMQNLLESWSNPMRSMDKLLEDPDVKVEDILAVAQTGSEKLRVLAVLSTPFIMSQAKENETWEASRGKVLKLVDAVKSEFKPAAVAEVCKVPVPDIVDVATASMIVRNKAFEKTVVTRNIQYAAECVVVLASVLRETALDGPSKEAAA